MENLEKKDLLNELEIKSKEIRRLHAICYNKNEALKTCIIYMKTAVKSNKMTPAYNEACQATILNIEQTIN